MMELREREVSNDAIFVSGLGEYTMATKEYVYNAARKCLLLPDISKMNDLCLFYLMMTICIKWMNAYSTIGWMMN